MSTYVWDYEFSAETDVDPAVLWDVFADVPGWKAWNAGIESIELHGPFAVGTTFAMTPPGEEPITMRITELVPGEVWTDVMDAGDFQVITVHRLEPAADGRTRIVYRTEITGPAAAAVGPEIGPAITSDFPDVVAALIAHAAGR